MKTELEEYLPVKKNRNRIFDDKFNMFLQCWLDIHAAGFADTEKEYIIEQTGKDQCEEHCKPPCNKNVENAKNVFDCSKKCRVFGERCVLKTRVHSYKGDMQPFEGRYFKQQFTFMKTFDIEVHPRGSLTDTHHDFVHVFMHTGTETVYFLFKAGEPEYIRYDYDEFVKEICIEIVKYVTQNKRVVLCGHSHGCVNALRVAQNLHDHQKLRDVYVVGSSPYAWIPRQDNTFEMLHENIRIFTIQHDHKLDPTLYDNSSTHHHYFPMIAISMTVDVCNSEGLEELSSHIVLELQEENKADDLIRHIHDFQNIRRSLLWVLFTKNIKAANIIIEYSDDNNEVDDNLLYFLVHTNRCKLLPRST